MAADEASIRFLLGQAATHRQRMDKLRELLTTDGQYGTGATPSVVVYSEASMRLLRLLDASGEPFAGPPLVIIPAPVSRYFILDLLPGRSFAAHLAQSGFDTYIVDFGMPADDERFADLDWYVNGLIRRALRAVRTARGTSAVDVIGYCLGGTLSLLYAATYPDEVKNLTLMTTLIDSSVEGGIAWMATRLGVDGESYEHPRIVPAATIKSWFEGLAPGSTSQEARVSDLLAQLDLPIEKLKEVRTMATWVDDVVPASGRMLAELSRKFGPAANELMTGRTTLGDREVELSRITMPVMSVSAARDHISPADGCDALSSVVPHAQIVRVPGGHVGAIAGSRSAALWDTVAQFHNHDNTGETDAGNQQRGVSLMSNPPLDKFQQQAIDALTEQQDAYLALVREWKRNAAAASQSSAEMPTMPTMPTMPGFSFPGAGEAPSPAELATQQQQFFARIAEQQQRFIASLNDILGSGR